MNDNTLLQLVVDKNLFKCGVLVPFACVSIVLVAQILSHEYEEIT
jgi:hypothetical protein